MSIWSWLFGSERAPAHTAPARGALYQLQPRPRLPEPRANFTDRDRQYVSNALKQFKECGLRITPELDPEVILVRALIEAKHWGFGADGKPPETGLRISSDTIQRIFETLANETDELTFYDLEAKLLLPKLASLEDGDADEVLQTHSFSIFDNALDISILHDNSEDMPFQIASLTSEEVNADQAEKILREFCIPDKRIDINPALNRLNGRTNKHGVFLEADSGSSEYAIILYILEADVPKITKLLRLNML